MFAVTFMRYFSDFEKCLMFSWWIIKTSKDILILVEVALKLTACIVMYNNNNNNNNKICHRIVIKLEN